VSISSVLLSGLSGLRAAQSALAVTSNNISNANTPGYVRAEVNLAPRATVGGVEISSIRRAADQFLTTASYIATAAQGAASARSELLTRAQSSFGDPTSTTSLFSTLDSFWSSLTALGVDPSSMLRRSDAVSQLQSTFGEVQRIGQNVQDLISEADQRISDDVNKSQDLINRIASLNDQIRLNNRTGADATGAENTQSQLIDQLSQLMDVRVSADEQGGVQVRTSGGALLVGVTAAKISYNPTTAPNAPHGVITLNADNGGGANLEPFLAGGEIKGLMQARDVDLANLAQALGGFSATLADALNQVHNENSTAPAPSQLNGRNTGLLGTDSIGFTGNAIVGVTNAAGVLTQRLTIDFDAKTITAEQPAGTFSFSGGTIASFTTALNGALAAATPAGSASFSGGVLSMNVGSNGGVVVQQDESDPSARGGRGFSQFFGLNDLVTSPTPMFFENGLKGTDPLGLNAGGEISYQVRDASGRQIATRTITISGSLANATATQDDLLNALNANGSGLGGFGTFARDSTGKVTFTPAAGYSVQMTGDSTQRGTTGVSFSALNGLSAASTAGRATSIDVKASIVANSSLLGAGRPDLSVALGSTVIESGDNTGAAALAAARDTVRNFSAAGSLGAQTGTLATYASRLGGEAGRLASDAQRASDGAEAIANAANTRRTDVEGVSLDDELMKMTVYQNSYAAAARVIQAASDMLDVLLSIGVS